MKLFIPSTRWDLGRVEKKLNKLEKEGWRLKKVFFACLYELEKDDSPPSRYLFTYSLPGEVGMEKEEDTVELLYGAKSEPLFPFKSRLKLWRLHEALPIAAQVKEKRRRHLHHCYFFCFVVCIFLCAFGVLMVGDTGNALLLALTFLCGVFSLLDVIGLIMTSGIFK